MPKTSQSVILVDASDRVLGFKNKTSAHRIPVPLHRAISIVIFNPKRTEMLITKRSPAKKTWPSTWSNAVCSHQTPGESNKQAARRRLKEELGIVTPLKEVFKFIYKAEMEKGGWGEHELDYVFVGKYKGKILADYREISGYEWAPLPSLKKDMRLNPKKYTPWFKLIFKKLYTHRK
ncbi:MAG TPA: isopentenyl-diphosphate Delta-isomerase [Patescibacteria group bacterium]|nr:isopentenyl-diphosphate Delta-isomerase [Patescibacteria group bacterium]